MKIFYDKTKDKDISYKIPDLDITGRVEDVIDEALKDLEIKNSIDPTKECHYVIDHKTNTITISQN